MPKTVITGAAGATTSTNAAPTDTDGKYFPQPPWTAAQLNLRAANTGGGAAIK